MFDQSAVEWLLRALGGIEEPLGVYFANQEPAGGLGYRGGARHSCLLKYVRLARARRVPGWVSRQEAGCVGGGVYMGFTWPPPDFIPQYVTTGLPGQEGERYLPGPASMHRFLDELGPRPAGGDYCVFKPLSQFQGGEEPLTVVFFARGEVLTGLAQLAYFSLDDHEAVAFPFGSGCANLLAWPLVYARRGLDRAVVGGADPSCRLYLEVDELTLAMTPKVFRRMLAAGPDSFLAGHTWADVLKKVAKSQKAWARH